MSVPFNPLYNLLCRLAGGFDPSIIKSVTLQVPLQAVFASCVEHTTPRRVQDGNSKRWPPFVELIDPLFHDRAGTDYNDRPSELLRIVQSGNECDGLDCLSEAHFIADDASDVLIV